MPLEDLKVWEGAPFKRIEKKVDEVKFTIQFTRELFFKSKSS